MTGARAKSSIDNHHPYPSSRKAWFLVVMLTVAYIFSFVDRYILGLLIQPIKADLGLTDEQIGWVIGPAFAIFYVTMGLPVGWLVDRARRTWIVAVGITVWSLATAASGLAKSFWHLFLTRMSVGIGEATLSPSAFSMIADSFPPERRGRPIAVYTAALTLGAGLASLIGGAVLVWAKTNDGIDVPWVGFVAPWQMVFFAVGLPGLLVALYFFGAKEPERRLTVAQDADLAGNGMADALGYVYRRAGTYGGFVSLVCIMTIIAYSQSFMPATFERTWGWPAEKYAFVNAIALLVIGPANVIIMGHLSDRWSQAGNQEAPFRLMVIGFRIMVPTATIPMFLPTAWSAMAVLFVNTIGIGMVSAVGVTALLLITPAQIRGQIVAIYYMAISLSGLLLGPTTIGFLSTRVFGEENIRLAMATLPVLYGIVPFLLIPTTRKLYLKQMQRLGAGSA